MVGMICAAALAVVAPSVELSTAKATARISLDGARVVSFRVGGDEVVWNTRVAGEIGANWNHGGIPICWPWFGTSDGHDPATELHGLVKNCRFEVISTVSCAERAQAVLRLRSDERTRKIWPHDFELVYEATLTDSLRLSLRTVNTGVDAFSFTAGFHPYFRLGNRNLAYVTGTDSLMFCDARVKSTLDETWRGDMKLTAACDHVFDERGASAAHSIVDPSLGRRIDITSSGVTRLVVWAPDDSEAAGGTPGPGQLAKGDCEHFVCVEPAFLWAGREITLQPGGRQQFDFEISVSPLK